MIQVNDLNKIIENKSRIVCITKVTNSCNLDCPYCYNKYNEKNTPHTIMSLDLLEKILINICTNYKSGEIIFHGGEPLLAGFEWYKDAFTLINKYRYKYKDVQIETAIQTNGTLITEKFLQLFRLNNCQIGLSFDGLNNENTRKDTEILLKNMNLMKTYKMNTGAILVITEETSDHIIENYEYFDMLQINPTFNIVHSDKYTGSNEYSKLNIENLAYNLCDFFNYYAINERNQYNFEHLDRMVAVVVQNYEYLDKHRLCCHRVCLNKWICISPNGDLYPCGKYWDKKFCMGNINNLTFPEAYQSDNYQMLANGIIKKLEYCKANCKYFKFCLGNCPNDAIVNGFDIDSPDVNTCYIYDKLYTHVYNYIYIEKLPIKRKNLIDIIKNGKVG